MKRLLSNKLSMPDGALFQQVDSMKGQNAGKEKVPHYIYLRDGGHNFYDSLSFFSYVLIP
jgi:hypothetical protein